MTGPRYVKVSAMQRYRNPVLAIKPGTQAVPVGQPHGMDNGMIMTTDGIVDITGDFDPRWHELRYGDAPDHVFAVLHKGKDLWWGWDDRGRAMTWTKRFDRALIYSWEAANKSARHEDGRWFAIGRRIPLSTTGER